jgi:hypothetical protein
MDETASFINGELIWKCEMPENIERRKDNEKNWREIMDFIAESRLYRIMDKEIQTNILIEAKRTNGRITDIEEWRERFEAQIQEKKDSKTNSQSLINIILSVIISVSAIVMAIPVIGKWLHL